MFARKSLATRLIGGVLVAAGVSLLSTSPALAATFTTDFNSGIPAEISLYGAAASYDHSTGGVNNSGCLKLVDRTGSQSSSAIISDLDSGATVAGFDVTFQVYIGSGTGADGMSFCFGDFSDAAWGEEGPGNIRGLTIAFDVYNNGGTPAEAPAIDLKWNNVTLIHRLVGATGTTTPASPIGTATTIRTQTTTDGAPVYVPVKIHVDPDGTLDLVWNSNIVFTNIPVFRPFFTDVDFPIYSFGGYRFGFGARTGGSADNHWIDNLSITTYPIDATSGQPGITLVSPQPAGLNASTAGGVEVVFTNSTYSLDTNKLTMRYNGTSVTPLITQTDGATRMFYRGNAAGLLPAGAGTVVVGYGTSSSFTNYFSFNFVVDPYATIPANYIIASVDTTKPGFKYRVVQHDGVTFTRAYATDPGRTLAAERQLARWYIDPSTGLPYENVADVTTETPVDGYFYEPDYINWSYDGTAIGIFSPSTSPARDEKTIKGIPGSTGSANWAAIEIIGYMYLTTGGHRFGFNSDDGFRVSFGYGPDAPSAYFAGNYDGARGQGTPTLFDVVVAQDGYYPVRILFWQGTGGFNAEFFHYDALTGNRVLVNDPTDMTAPRVYSESLVSRPYISRVIPVQNWIGASPDDNLVIDITDGGYPLAGSSVSIAINGVAQTFTAAKNGKVTTLTRASSLSNLLPSGLNTVTLVYGYNDNGTMVSLTNTYSYTVAPYYNLIPAGNKVPAGMIGTDTGFRAKVTQMDRSGDATQANGARISGGWDANRMPAPEVQLSGGEINPTNGLAYPNLAAPGANNFLYDFDFINWQYNNAAAAVAQSGWVQSTYPASPFPGALADVGVPGFPGTGTSYGGLENGVMEITTYLELKAGVQIFGFNSDDGFIAICAPDPHDTLGTLVGFDNRGRGNSALPVAPTGVAPSYPPLPGNNSGSTLFSVIVPEDGIYPFRILFWQGGTGFNAEFFSINKSNYTYLLVGDAGNGGIPAYRTYSGPARPWVKFSVCPTPWDNSYQQSGPGPIKMLGRTRAQVTSSDIYNRLDAATPTRPWPNVPIGAVVANGTSEANLRLLLNGTEVAATKTTNGTDVTISYQPNPPLPSGSTNTASLVYAGTTNSWTFAVQTWTNLNEADAVPLGSGDANARGFRVKMAQTTSTTGYTANSTARAEAQLAGVLSPNLAKPGPNADGTYTYPNIINWTNGNPANTPQGNFQANTYGAATGWPFAFYADEPIPGVPGTGLTVFDYCAAEIFAYLEFPTAGMYWFGVNSDDGFALKAGMPGVTNGVTLGTFDLSGGKGFSDVPFSFMVPKAGLYPLRLVWHNGTGGAGVEFFSYTATGGKIAINDTNNPAAIKAYYAVTGIARPTITSVTLQNGSVVILWINGGTLESAPSILGPWSSTGTTSGTFSEPAAGPMKFYRVKQ